ncbi:unnamed protein product, partial [Ceratitis capitata]
MDTQISFADIQEDFCKNQRNDTNKGSFEISGSNFILIQVKRALDSLVPSDKKKQSNYALNFNPKRAYFIFQIQFHLLPLPLHYYDNNSFYATHLTVSKNENQKLLNSTAASTLLIDLTSGFKVCRSHGCNSTFMALNPVSATLKLGATEIKTPHSAIVSRQTNEKLKTYTIVERAVKRRHRAYATLTSPASLHLLLFICAHQSSFNCSIPCALEGTLNVLAVKVSPLSAAGEVWRSMQAHCRADSAYGTRALPTNRHYVLNERDASMR